MNRQVSCPIGDYIQIKENTMKKFINLTGNSHCYIGQRMSYHSGEDMSSQKSQLQNK